MTLKTRWQEVSAKYSPCTGKIRRTELVMRKDFLREGLYALLSIPADNVAKNHNKFW